MDFEEYYHENFDDSIINGYVENGEASAVADEVLYYISEEGIDVSDFEDDDFSTLITECIDQVSDISLYVEETIPKIVNNLINVDIDRLWKIFSEELYSENEEDDKNIYPYFEDNIYDFQDDDMYDLVKKYYGKPFGNSNTDKQMLSGIITTFITDYFFDEFAYELYSEDIYAEIVKIIKEQGVAPKFVFAPKLMTVAHKLFAFCT